MAESQNMEWKESWRDEYLKWIFTRVETHPYPKEAIREAILNAIAHKNYATLVPIQIRVYDDKLMIANDCVFP